MAKIRFYFEVLTLLGWIFARLRTKRPVANMSGMHPLRLIAALCFCFTLALAQTSAPQPSGKDKSPPRTVIVRGGVANPGIVQFPADRGLSITDAISLAGGHTRLGDLKRVRVTRKGADGKENTRFINVHEIMTGKKSEVPDLEPGDIVEVGQRII